MSLIYLPAEDSFLLSCVLQDKIPKILLKNKNIRVLEIGAGCGVQLKVLLNSGVKRENIFACDLNPDAVRHCKKLGFNCIESNLFKKIHGKYNLIIFNPPYLPQNEDEPEESALATTGGKKGGEIISEFLKFAKKYLSKGGKIFLLTSSLTKGISWHGYKRKCIKKQKLFFEELKIWEVRPK